MPSTAGADVKTAAEAMNGKYQSSIVIDGLRIMARHGVWPQETTVGNMFEVSVRLDFDAAGAMMAPAISSQWPGPTLVLSRFISWMASIWHSSPREGT